MSVRLLRGDCREILPTLDAESVDCIVTSPPYWGLRDYGVACQIGLEPTLDAYLETMIGVCRELRRVLKPEGTFWLNIGDSYANDGKWGGETGGKQHYLGEANRKRVGREKRVTGLKPKDLCMVPNRLAILLQDDGWWVRSEIIWHKLNPMPESVTDRPTTAHEKIWLLTKSERYFYDADAIKEEVTGGAHSRKAGKNSRAFVDRDPRHAGQSPKTAEPGRGIKANSSYHAAGGNLVDSRNKRTVWSVASEPFPGSHFATFPPGLIEPCIQAGCPVGGTVLDPFFGAGTAGLVADRLGRNCIGIELNPEYSRMAAARIEDDAPLFAEVSA